MPLNPKALFQLESERAKILRDITRNDGFQIALTFALAETVAAYRLDAAQIEGIQKFTEVLLNLGEPVLPGKTFPVRSLNHDIDPVRGERAKPSEQQTPSKLTHP